MFFYYSFLHPYTFKNNHISFAVTDAKLQFVDNEEVTAMILDKNSSTICNYNICTEVAVRSSSNHGAWSNLTNNFATVQFLQKVAKSKLCFLNKLSNCNLFDQVCSQARLLVLCNNLAVDHFFVSVSQCYHLCIFAALQLEKVYLWTRNF